MAKIILSLALLFFVFSSFSYITADGGNDNLNPPNIYKNNGANNNQTQNGLGPNSWKKDLFFVVVSTILAYALVVIAESLKTPNFVFTEDQGSVDRMSIYKVNHKFIHITITNYNKKTSRLPSFLLPDTLVALGTKTTITIKDRNDRTFGGRWSNHPQPLPNHQIVNNKIYEIPDVNALVQGREDIHPQPRKMRNWNTNESKSVCLGIKWEGEKEFYLFNNSSYYYGYKYPDSKFSKGTYNGRLVLSTMGIQKNIDFKIYNETTRLKDFKIELN